MGEVTTSIGARAVLWGPELRVERDAWVNVDAGGRVLSLTHEVVDAPSSVRWDNSLLVPAFLNAHAHLVDGLFKCAGWELDLGALVAPPAGLKHRLLASAPPEELKRCARLTALDALGSGFTRVVDFREGGAAGVRLLAEATKGTDSPEFLFFGRPSGGDLEAELGALLEAGVAGVGLSSLSGVTAGDLECLLEWRKRSGRQLAWHLAEAERKHQFLETTLETRPDHVVHCTQLNARDLSRLAENDVGIVLCPSANAFFGVGRPPLVDALSLDRVALGTDNAFANAPDPFQELSFALRLVRNDPRGRKVTAGDLLELFTTKAAKCLRVERDAGCLAPGKRADFFSVDLSSPGLCCQDPDFHRLLVDRVRASDVHAVFLAGRLVHHRPLGLRVGQRVGPAYGRNGPKLPTPGDSGRPHVLFSAAATLDGKIATRTGHSELSDQQDWVEVHAHRRDSDAVVVGVGTALADDPKLRLKFHAPRREVAYYRVVVDSTCRLPLESNLVTCEPDRYPTIVATTERAPHSKRKALKDKGVRVLVAGSGPRVDLRVLLEKLAELGVRRVMLEGGGTLAWGFFELDLVDEVRLFVAPRVVGGNDATSLVEGEGFPFIRDSPKFKLADARRRGDYLVLHYRRERVAR
ncbi:MAG: hypothetical protein Kow0069_19330 [Promethearchaeota archaeon]